MNPRRNIVTVMRIVSLLPSATEIVYALGLGDDLVGVTHECDFPPGASAKRHISFSRLPASGRDGPLDAAEVDGLVSASINGGEPIYGLDAEAIRELKPDLVLSQDLCQVCAVPSGRVTDALDVLGCSADVLSLDPSSVDEVLGCVLAVGDSTGSTGRAHELVTELRERIERVREAVSGLDRTRTFALEWSDPPFNGGHWVPEMIELAGCDPVLGSRGADSHRVSWDEIERAAPDAIVFMPCGYDADQAAAEGRSILGREEIRSVPSVFVVDATSYFSRPGPRLVDGIEILASILHQELGPVAGSRAPLTSLVSRAVRRLR